jgi:hypothetical protein
MKREDCICYSGAANGAEAEFGAAAERYGIDEVNFTFEGHTNARQRGLRVLTKAELRHGDVSLGYLSKLMHRKYPDTPMFRKVLQTIWHQVDNGQEIFVVGKINPDDTVTGGTGIAAEYAKLFNRPVYVFDQVRSAWFAGMANLGNHRRPANSPAALLRHGHALPRTERTRRHRSPLCPQLRLAELVGRETHRLPLPATALGAVDARPLAARCLQHLEHGYAPPRRQGRRIDPQAVAAALPLLARTAGAGQIVPRFLRKQSQPSVDRRSYPDQGHTNLILNIRAADKFPLVEIEQRHRDRTCCVHFGPNRASASSRSRRARPSVKRATRAVSARLAALA